MIRFLFFLIGTNEINITFVHLIESKKPVNISIYQKLEERYRLRQKLEGEYLLRQKLLCTEPNCMVVNNYSLRIKLLDTTFNLPNATYSVEIDDEFLNYQNENIPVPGMKLGK